MLPKDAERRRQRVPVENPSRDGPHLNWKPGDQTAPYSHHDRLFREAAVEWLISTDQVCQGNVLTDRMPVTLHPPTQPIQVLQHPSFRHMIHVAAGPENGVEIADHHQTHQTIINMFVERLTALRENLTV